MSDDSIDFDSDLNSSSNNEELLMDSNEETDENNNNNPQESNEATTNNQSNSTSDGYSTRSRKSNLIFSSTNIHNRLREDEYAERIQPSASIYLASVLEYLSAEILELAGDIAQKSKQKRIAPRDIALAIKNDPELSKLCSNVTIPEGGVQPFIHQELLNTNRRRQKRRVRFSQDTYKRNSSKKRNSTSNRSTRNNSDDNDE